MRGCTKGGCHYNKHVELERSPTKQIKERKSQLDKMLAEMLFVQTLLSHKPKSILFQPKTNLYPVTPNNQNLIMALV